MTSNLIDTSLTEIHRVINQLKVINNITFRDSSPKHKIYDYLESELKYNDTAILYYWYTECIQNEESLSHWNKILEPYRGKYKFCQSTIDMGEELTHPYTNIFRWRDIIIKNNVMNTFDHGMTRLFDKRYMFDSTFKNNKRSFNHILSVRRKTDGREALIKSIDTDKLDIFRYFEIDTDEENTNHKKSKIDSRIKGYPMWSELMEEYSKTYFSFIVETNFDASWPYNPFSEKTLISFYLRSIPVVFGHKNMIKKLENLGFWTANYDFGYREIESLSSEDSNRIGKFSQMINQITDMTDKQIHEYYHDNYKNIYQNWKLLTDIFKVGITTI